jgi:hypothetical protein
VAGINQTMRRKRQRDRNGIKDNNNELKAGPFDLFFVYRYRHYLVVMAAPGISSVQYNTCIYICFLSAWVPLFSISDNFWRAPPLPPPR